MNVGADDGENIEAERPDGALRRFHVIINREAGALIGQNLDDVHAAIRAALGVIASEIKIHDAHAQEFSDAVKAAAADADCVIVAGGDGSVSTAAAIVRDAGKVLGIIPFGTYNLLARDLNMPMDFPSALQALAAGSVQAIDVGELNGRLFLCQSGFGFFTRLAHARQKARNIKLGKWVQAFKAFFVALRGARAVHVSLDTDGKRLSFKTLAMLITINSYHRNPNDPLRRDRLDGGKLALYWLRYHTIAGLLRFAVRLLLRTWPKDQNLEIVAAPSITVTGGRRRRRMAVTLDGELAVMPTPLQYRVHPRGLKVLAAPPPAST